MSSRRKIILPVGYCGKGFEGVMNMFKQTFLQGVDKGSSLAVYHRGACVVNTWGGFADEQSKRPWKEDTLGYFYSGTKYLSSVVIASLVEKGLLNYNETVSTYWPEFAQNGKEGVTLSMMLSHTAGLSVLEENYDLAWMRDDPRLLVDLLQKQQPLWEPGTKIAYSAVLVGLYLNEIVKRVDHRGRSLSEYFHDEIAVPFGLEIYIGLPKILHYRTSKLIWRKYSSEEVHKALAEMQPDMDLYMKSAYQPRDWNTKFKLHDPEFAQLPVPSSHSVGTAKAAAKFAGIISNGGEYEGKSLLAQISIDNLQKVVAHGKDASAGGVSTFGQGTMLIPVRQGNKTWFLFGHGGLGGQVILSDPVKKFGFAYCTNYCDVFTTFNKNNKWKPLLEAVYSCIQKIDGDTEKVKLFGSYSELLKDVNDNPIGSRL